MPSDEAWKNYESGEAEEKEKVSWNVTVSSHRYLRYFRHRRVAWNRGAVMWVSLRSPSRTEVEGLDYGQSPGESHGSSFKVRYEKAIRHCDVVLWDTSKPRIRL
ncbi:hypothetical protein FOXG_06411 [Fusarium oxysporum f. sp. lycopersici 4287]|uniref:Uncharacterized protein n=3 Tax=Fusarium oxysporum TaxID=5507 RepID=A0A0J9UZ96_FUSO4|nr:hypothetical protein FOXG_06411 [Fusarium oxysporum f. sp. lycopersici 4287]EXK35222.1 hypothetical protein FOMG_10425 [Fusarium oxysporum f. sp. melonis 26406]KNB04218.1 hypothetical protein FOXG_06411 [Fusarium oxysporum f. sp. lycopersici 4287]